MDTYRCKKWNRVPQQVRRKSCSETTSSIQEDALDFDGGRLRQQLTEPDAHTRCPNRPTSETDKETSLKPMSASTIDGLEKVPSGVVFGCKSWIGSVIAFELPLRKIPLKNQLFRSKKGRPSRQTTINILGN